MRLHPASVKLEGAAGNSFTVAVLIEGVTNLGGFEFEIRFDDSVLSVVDIREGPFLSGVGDTSCVESTLIAGIARFECILKGGPSGPSGSGVLAEVDFSLKISFVGLGQLFLMGCDIADPYGYQMPLNGCKDGELVANPTPTPPPPVGGVSHDPDAKALAQEGVRSSASGSLWAVVLASAMGTAGALGTAAWLVRRRS